MNRDIIIGKIVGTHGNKGVLKVHPITDFPDRFLGMGSITVDQGGLQKTYTIEKSDRYRKHILIKLAELPDMNGAEALRGAYIKAAREELEELPEGSYYVFEIVGLKVFAAGGEPVGVVEDVIHTGANDVYVVNTGEEPPVLVPALKDVVKEIDIKGGRMVVNLDLLLY
ncbi:MAG: ribosome maturation factor RimM [Bacillota bacterium]